MSDIEIDITFVFILIILALWKFIDIIIWIIDFMINHIRIV